MKSFRFLHAADVHLDSPLHGIARYEGIPLEEVRGATRAAFDNLIGLALQEHVDFLVISGDLYDGEWKHMGTGLYFAHAMGQLDRAGIPVFLLAGNHDAASVITRQIPWPANVRLFSSRQPQTHLLEDLCVAVHGQSFAMPAVTENLVTKYPDSIPHAFNVGVLHTALSGALGHATYAPCDVPDLRVKGYDYWALGHVHAFQIVSTEPYIVYPGNIQGRNIRETGPKGAVLVEVADRQVTSVRPVELDVLRWSRMEVDCTDARMDGVNDLIRSSLRSALPSEGAGRPLIVRVTLHGSSEIAGTLKDRAAELRDDVCAIATSISPDLWIEKVISEVTSPPAVQGPNAGLDFAEIMDEARLDPELVAELKTELESFLVSARSSLGAPEEDELRALAEAGSWDRILEAGATALRARLVGDA
jgi:DNA repair protein SbcD/Mre11